MTPAEIYQHLKQLPQRKPPLDVPVERWRQLLIDSRDFVRDDYCLLAFEYGWTTLDLWGAHRTRPFRRIDCQGLLWLVNGAAIDDLDAAQCAMIAASGARAVYRRRLATAGDDVCLPWEL